MTQERAVNGVKDLSDNTERTLFDVGEQVEKLRSEVHQHAQDYPRKMTLLNSEVEIHSEEVIISNITNQD